jgi:hypothetical protein
VRSLQLPVQALHMLAATACSLFPKVWRGIWYGTPPACLAESSRACIRFVWQQQASTDHTGLPLARSPACLLRARRCALVHAQANPSKATQVPLALMQRALELQGLPKDDGEGGAGCCTCAARYTAPGLLA